MKICVLGLDGAAHELIFGDGRLVNLRRLMDLGVYGRMESVNPPVTIPDWMCMCTSQDPGSLGIYGFRNRADHSYEKIALATADAVKGPAIWEHIAIANKKSILVGVPPNYPPRQVNGLSIGCSLTPAAIEGDFTYPTTLKAKLTELVGEYPVDVKNLGFGKENKAWLKQEIFDMSRKQWQVVRWLLTEQEWDYFQFVDIGLKRIQQAFWGDFDPNHSQFKGGNPYQDVIPEYYRWLDEQIGAILELLDDETILLVASDHGAQRLNGGFAINEWLIREGLLVLNEYPKTPTPFETLSVNWGRTKVWSEGGCCARIFFNLREREPQGIVPASQYESFQNEMKARLEALPGEEGVPLKSSVFRPDEIYQAVRNVAPDLIVHVGELHWRAITSVGHSKLHLHDENIVPDGCNHSPYGMFILTSPNCPLGGEYEGARLLDIAPTLLDLAGYGIPGSMQGRSLVVGVSKKNSRGGSDGEGERIVHDRLAGLGYV